MISAITSKFQVPDFSVITLSYLFVSGKRYLAAMPFESERVTLIPTDFGELIG
jgi:hypothetical protein